MITVSNFKTVEVLRDLFSYVGQDNYLFDGTIEENIQFGRPGSNLERVRDAAAQAEIDEFIMSLPQGYQRSYHKCSSNFSWHVSHTNKIVMLNLILF